MSKRSEDRITQPIPFETLNETAAKWAEEVASSARPTRDLRNPNRQVPK